MGFKTTNIRQKSNCQYKDIIHIILFLYHSKVFLSPSFKEVSGCQPNSFLAFAMETYCLFISFERSTGGVTFFSLMDLTLEISINFWTRFTIFIGLPVPKLKT